MAAGDPEKEPGRFLENLAWITGANVRGVRSMISAGSGGWSSDANSGNEHWGRAYVARPPSSDDCIDARRENVAREADEDIGGEDNKDEKGKTVTKTEKEKAKRMGRFGKDEGGIGWRKSGETKKSGNWGPVEPASAEDSAGESPQSPDAKDEELEE